MRYGDIITIDFETAPIQDRPAFPPTPCGLAIKYGAEDAIYMACGHKIGDNEYTHSDVRNALREAFESGKPLLFHNAYFDLAVACEYYDLPLPSWDRVHDTAVMAFLLYPHARKHDLKSLAEEHLDWAPEERDAIGDWVWENRAMICQEYDLNPTRSGGRVNSVFRYFEVCPAYVVGPYAAGDVDRTFSLFVKWAPMIAKSGMSQAYRREMEVAPIFYRNEVEGIAVDRESLEKDHGHFEVQKAAAEEWLKSRLDRPFMNFDADSEIVEALRSNDMINPEDWQPTDAGIKFLAKNPGMRASDLDNKYLSVSKDRLRVKSYADPQVFQVLGYRNRLQTAMKMFMLPWMNQAALTGGRIHTHWATTRGGSGGTRTGRPATSSPNFLNISKSFEGRTDGYEHPTALTLSTLPLVRRYIVADTEDHTILHRDFNGQELRVFADYESGPLYAAYQSDPSVDVHGLVSDNIKRLFPEAPLDRSKTKIINFQSLYGGGASALANVLDVSLDEAKRFKEYHNQAMPGRVALNNVIKTLVRQGVPVRTWGGRAYLPEEPRMIEGRMRSFEYKLINYIIQGSAADITKQAMIDWNNHPDNDSRFLLQVYDELNIVCHKDAVKKQMSVLKDVMEASRLDVEMLSEGKIGPSWGSMEDYSD